MSKKSGRLQASAFFTWYQIRLWNGGPLGTPARHGCSARRLDNDQALNQDHQDDHR